ARVCAGEFCKPGSFSLKTLEVVRTLDPEVALAFERYRACLSGTFLLCSEDLEPSLERCGVSQQDRSELKDAGLIDSERYMTFSKVAVPIQFPHRDRIVRLTPIGAASIPDNLWFQLSRSHLTRCGRELDSVLPRTINEEYFRDLGWHLTWSLRKQAKVDWSFVEGNEWFLFGCDPVEIGIVEDAGKWLISCNHGSSFRYWTGERWSEEKGQ